MVITAVAAGCGSSRPLAPVCIPETTSGVQPKPQYNPPDLLVSVLVVVAAVAAVQYTPADKNRKPHQYAALPPPPPEFTVVAK
jgi:hypothetical protein